MLRREKIHPELERLNLVPIMDAVFIFIFFLLFSAQFIKIFEIETAAPIISEVPSNVSLKEEPLNLKVKVYTDRLQLHTGIDQEKIATYKKSDSNYLEKLKFKVLSLRLKHQKEDHIVISPENSIMYNEIIALIDTVQTLPKDKIYKIKVEEEEVILKKIFTQLVLEPISEI